MAQVAHASLASLLKLFTITKSETLEGGFLEPGQISFNYELSFGPNTVLDDWLNGKFTKIVVSVPGEKELLELYEKLQNSDAVTETMEGDGAGGASLDLYLPSPVDNCSITWAVFIAGDYNLLMLVEIVGPTSSKYFQVVSYDLGNWGIIGGC